MNSLIANDDRRAFPRQQKENGAQVAHIGKIEKRFLFIPTRSAASPVAHFILFPALRTGRVICSAIGLINMASMVMANEAFDSGTCEIDSRCGN